MKVLLLLSVLLGCAKYTVGQGNPLVEAQQLAIFWINVAEGDIVYYREWLTQETDFLSYGILERTSEYLETASNPAAGAVIQECVEASTGYTNQLMISVDRRLQIVQKEVTELHKLVLDEILATNLMTTNFDLFPEAFRERLDTARDYIDVELFESVFDAISEMYFANFEITFELSSCLEAARK